jgi:hypothetical protein
MMWPNNIADRFSIISDHQGMTHPQDMGSGL